MRLHVGLRCDGGPEIGVGHLIRCLALADELVARGAEVTLIGDLGGVSWVEEQVIERGLARVAAPGDAEALAALADRLGLDVVVLDGYRLDPHSGRALREAGVTVLAISDGPFGARQEADIVLDQNLGATADPARPGTALTGLDYVLFRDQVLRHRRASTQPVPLSTPPRVLTVFGGTDAYAAGPVVVPLLLETGLPLHVIAVAPRPEIAQELRAVAPGRGQTIEVIPPVEDLAALAVTCDLTVTASGTSVWEFLCLGVPAALICVTDNQAVGYRAVSDGGYAVPVGLLSELRHNAHAREAAVASLRRLLDDPTTLHALAERGQRLVDGRGRQRVADALEYHHSARSRMRPCIDSSSTHDH
jgi:spore coat polysaccharide biosynthesis predicted glycosyltransferase SpsG